jgi:hypothetical protein
MTTKHSPGPWDHRLYAGGHQAGVYSETGGRDVALVYDPDNGDARLIAAAPELAAVLRDFVLYVSPGDDVPLAAMLDDARAALAKLEE